ncbi:MAG: dihydroorotate dehydrogenase-like protein [Lentisphaerae bacterium]|nr:MAG: dihydroorotate dehydrogenase-like protein [Lentisphaerota bacterium]
MDLKTKYLGIELESPLIAGPGPFTHNIDNFTKLRDAGAAAIVMHSLFEEQVRNEAQDLDYYLSYGTESFAEALSYFPEPEVYQTEADQYLKILEQASAKLDVPVIASLNGVSSKGWTQYAKKMQDAGASAIELNIYFLPTQAELTGGEVEKRYIDILSAVKSSVSIPVAVKLNPYFSSLANMAVQLKNAGADGLVLFNRFYQPDIDIDKLEVECKLELSSPSEIRLPLLWLATISAAVPELSLAATSGVHSGKEAVKYLMAGANVVMLTSKLVRDGIASLADVRKEMLSILEGKGYNNIGEVVGVMNRAKIADPTAYERANYIKVLKSVRI